MLENIFRGVNIALVNELKLVYAAMGLGAIGVAFMALGFLNPHVLHSLHVM